MFKIEDWLTPKTVEKYGNMLRTALRNLDSEAWENALKAFSAVNEIVDNEMERRIDQVSFHV